MERGAGERIESSPVENTMESSRVEKDPLHLLQSASATQPRSLLAIATSNGQSINDGNEEEDDDQIAAVALDNQCFVGLQLCKLS